MATFGIVPAMVVAFALVLPFEARLFRLGPIEITTVEACLYALIAAWGLRRARLALRDPSSVLRAVSPFRRDALVSAAVLWCLVLFVSALAATTDRAACFKFALRSLSGVVGFFVVRDVASTPEIRRRVVWALVAGAVVSAVTAIVDSLVPSSGMVWGRFREGAFDTFGLPRASGVFGYPTMGAMYWEAALPLVVVAPFLGLPADNARARRPVVLAVVASIPLVVGILASATRTALAGGAVACIAVLWATWSWAPRVRYAAGGALGVLVVSWGVALMSPGSGGLLAQRLRWWHDDAWFRVEYAVDTTPRAAVAGDVFLVPVTVRNRGALTWPHAGPRPMRVSYHWEPLRGPTRAGDFEGRRTDLPADVPPGGVLEVVATVRAPAVDGSYRLRWDLVQEDVTWFSERGNAMPEQRVDVVRAPGGAEPLPETGDVRALLAPPPPPRPALWHAAVVLWRRSPLLGVGPDQFRRLYEAVLSPSPTGQPYTDTRLHANSLYFETLADLGLAGIAALGWMASALAREAGRWWKAGDMGGLGCCVAAGTFFVHGGLDYFFEFTPLFGLFWVVVGLAGGKAN